MTTLKIDHTLFMLTFSADSDYHEECKFIETYLNKRSGEVMTIYTDRERAENLYGKDAVVEFRKNKNKLRASPNNYLRIPSMDHGEHHDLLKEFLCTNWTEDEVARNHASNVYYSRRSIGFWLKNVGDDKAITAYMNYAAEAPEGSAERFLHENGIVDFVWG
ncbi:MAG: hypothetical protein WC742_11595 [Gallionellaceae bacterium]|jgi:hypothetical protein